MRLKQPIPACSSALVAGLLLAASANCQNPETEPATRPADTLKIFKHSGWSDIEPKGVQAYGIRRNLAVGDSVTFEELTLGVTETVQAKTEEEADGPKPENVTLSLAKGEETATRTLDEGQAFNWRGYHVSVVAIYARRGDLGHGSTVLEVATVESLPEEIAESNKANGAEYRIRVPHEIDKLTLHHSATPHSAEDDLGQKLKNMQIWGENDRNWWDIPYHFVIDVDGVIYEGRDYNYVGDTNTRYNPAGHFLINCYGNYNEAEPNEAQLEAIAKLMAWAAEENDIEPLKIYGHSDLAQTSCPGKNLQEYIDNGTLKEMVEKELEGRAPKALYVSERP